MNTNKKLHIIALTICCLIIIVTVVVLHTSATKDGIFETNDPIDYLNIDGNYDNRTPTAFVNSFFPEKIEDYYENVVYHYKAKKFDTYAYEVWLEFTISDYTAYHSYVEQVTNGASAQCPVFAFDARYREYTISNVFFLTHLDEYGYYIESAEIGKILFSDDAQKLIFVALGVYDGGGTSVTDLNYFFSKFEIDPTIIAQQSCSEVP